MAPMFPRAGRVTATPSEAATAATICPVESGSSASPGEQVWVFIALVPEAEGRNTLADMLRDINKAGNGQRPVFVPGPRGGKAFFEYPAREQFMARYRLPGVKIVYLLEHEMGLKDVIANNVVVTDSDILYVSVASTQDVVDYGDIPNVIPRVAATIIRYAYSVGEDWKLASEGRGVLFDLSKRMRGLDARSKDLLPKTSVISDIWTINDKLGYEVFADAVAAFLRHQDTKPPLTVGIRAPWGAGKTSLMRMIRNTIDPAAQGRPDATGPGLPEIGVKEGATYLRGELRFGALLKMLGRQKNAGKLVAEVPDDHRITVWFNPWMYQSSEQVWAGLAYEIITQVTGRLSRVGRETFWLRLNASRVDPEFLRRAVHSVMWRQFAPAVVLLVLAGLSTVVAMISDLSRFFVHDVLGPAGVGLALLLSLYEYWRLRRKRLGDVLGGLVRWRDPLHVEPTEGGEVSLTIADPFYEARAGLLRFVLEDVRNVLALVATERRPVVIFIDDLDRCSPAIVAKVIEAVNAFLAGEFPNCEFVIAMEPRAVVASIEEAYQRLLAGLMYLPQAEGITRASDGGPSPGWRFLDKLVQLPVQLPVPDAKNVLEGYLASLGQPIDVALTGTRDAQGGESIAATTRGDEGTPQEDQTREDEIMESLKQARSLDEILDRADKLRGTVPGDVLTRLASAVFDERFRPSNPEVMKIVKEQLEPVVNAREVKRFVNLFRFYAIISARIRLQGQPSAKLAEAAVLAALATRWPDVVGRARDAQALLGLAQGTGQDQIPPIGMRFDGIDPSRLKAISEYLRAHNLRPDALRLLVG